MRKHIFIIALIVATLACNFSTDAATPDMQAIQNLARTQAAIELTQTAIAAPTKAAPTITVAPPTSAPPSATPIPPTAAPQNGSISGTLGYPSEGIPALTVFAINRANSKDFYFVETAFNQQNFTIKNVPPGVYSVLAYLKGSTNLIGGWTKYSTCWTQANCPQDHTLLPVAVKPGENVTGVAVVDWYAPPNTFPPRPSK